MASKAPKIEGINLVGIQGRYARQIFGLPPGRATVGRESDNDLVLTGSSLSRRHAMIQPSDATGTWLLEDVESANGTWVNQKRITGKTSIRHGDRIRFAQDDFLFVDADNHKFDTRGYRIAEKESVLLGKLIFDRGRGPEELLLEETTVTIGREETNDVALELPGVSGNHCKIRTVDEAFTLVDLKSTNGTYLEGSEDRVEEVLLKPGMAFLVGACRFQFETESVTRAKPSQAPPLILFQGPTALDLILPVAAAFLVLLTIFFATLVALNPPASPQGPGITVDDFQDLPAPGGPRAPEGSPLDRPVPPLAPVTTAPATTAPAATAPATTAPAATAPATTAPATTAPATTAPATSAPATTAPASTAPATTAPAATATAASTAPLEVPPPPPAVLKPAPVPDEGGR